ncbi:hypothetical protein PYS58_09735 [Chryseobacterium indologenes]|uniref:hypothetical protein n=1 Tax=Chryseobacterium TaxID=59732 RepID=UPI001623D8CF|nr:MULTISPECIES: hypothetical protein [Chryseobacterium]MDM1555580.1 hypothetical protein [Chryseobacterium indologenes]WET51408.1 hypothetical protein PYS58_09735 [Chryseobacterium indologenes]
MKSILVVINILLFSVSIYGQAKDPDEKISTQDKIILQKFWKVFTDAVIRNDKAKLETLCDFPFYCRPCIDYAEYKNGNPITVKVTRKLYHKKHYKVFFEQALKTEVKKHQKFAIQFFRPSFNEQRRRTGVYFLYTIVPPSAHWEGAQGMIYLIKKEGKFKIAGIDTIP